ncbi:hypothetical protein PABG_11666 [Paracoccidioides brasiliensis Pb03]|nr:hypothetical protein PABG_11666 [Paracoccidioides brasiliensis Pb03]
MQPEILEVAVGLIDESSRGWGWVGGGDRNVGSGGGGGLLDGLPKKHILLKEKTGWFEIGGGGEGGEEVSREGFSPEWERREDSGERASRKGRQDGIVWFVFWSSHLAWDEGVWDAAQNEGNAGTAANNGHMLKQNRASHLRRCERLGNDRHGTYSPS